MTSFILHLTKIEEKEPENDDVTHPQSFQEELARCYSVSEDFQSFRRSFVSFLGRRYCQNCVVDPMSFVFGIWCVGVFMVSIGVVFLITCSGSRMATYYLISDGILSIFFYPLLFAYWPLWMGLSSPDSYEDDPDDSSAFRWWLAVLVIRLLTLIASSALLPLYHQHQQCCHENLSSDTVDSLFPNFCSTTYPVALSALIFGWVCLLSTAIPILLCLLLFQLAPFIAGPTKPHVLNM
ncbi:Hypothetical predicted protein [Octopus vulgaris]|uniref:Uncharacterized protein n=2 Tax=Octopus TaxID=6643 RepID=A0AA36BBR5_OCTVU|nr:uncharacterized protein LOC115217935 [Octopus sinensis]XP_036363922.1 uncharacterized protein LOC115217935 [Octopus sinensis]XP_036363923.1 uncharacterized protein LOC115217935 [Octopus sinensis]CAI9731214.1 Hypothetical predicted protein [Octopus vulgaris]